MTGLLAVRQNPPPRTILVLASQPSRHILSVRWVLSPPPPGLAVPYTTPLTLSRHVFPSKGFASGEGASGSWDSGVEQGSMQRLSVARREAGGFDRTAYHSVARGESGTVLCVCSPRGWGVIDLLPASYWLWLLSWSPVVPMSRVAVH